MDAPTKSERKTVPVSGEPRVQATNRSWPLAILLTLPSNSIRNSCTFCFQSVIDLPRSQTSMFPSPGVKNRTGIFKLVNFSILLGWGNQNLLVNGQEV